MPELRTAINVMVAFMCTCSLKQDHFPFLIFIIDINDIVIIKTKQSLGFFNYRAYSPISGVNNTKITWQHQ
jgi:hypothetical protein